MPETCPLPILTACSDSDQASILAEAVGAATAAGRRLRIVGGDTKAFLGRGAPADVLDVSGHRGVISHEPTELVITARAGTPIADIEAVLAAHGQRLAFEPPIFGAASTLGGVVAAGLSGPRRPFAGAVRDSVLGVTVLNGQGQALRLGGTVFKNVAGFDGFRLMAGAFGSLGVLLDVSLRVSPIPLAETALSFEGPWLTAFPRVTALMRRPLPIDGICHDGERLHVRLSGAPVAVDAAIAELGGEPCPPDLWSDVRHMRHPCLAAPRLWRLSLPHTNRFDTEAMADGAFRDWAGAQIWLGTDAPAERLRDAAVAAGGHATLFRGAGPDEAVFTPLAPPLMALHRRLKAAFDPAGVFNPGRMYEGL